jgi:cell division protein FtsX
MDKGKTVKKISTKHLGKIAALLGIVSVIYHLKWLENLVVVYTGIATSICFVIMVMIWGMIVFAGDKIKTQKKEMNEIGEVLTHKHWYQSLLSYTVMGIMVWFLSYTNHLFILTVYIISCISIFVTSNSVKDFIKEKMIV